MARVDGEIVWLKDMFAESGRLKGTWRNAGTQLIGSVAEWKC
jgi:hypothetical protein